MFKFKKPREDIAKHSTTDKFRDGVVTLTKETVAYVEEKNGSPSIELRFVGMQQLNGQEEKVRGVIFNLRASERFSNGNYNFMFKAIEEFRLASNWGDNENYIATTKTEKGLEVQTHRVDIDFTGVQIVVAEDKDLYKGRTIGITRLITAGRDNLTVSGEDIYSIYAVGKVKKKLREIEEKRKKRREQDEAKQN